ncbi:iron complex transport system ATP-binding protein [Streptoalloteichus tenebrarius]|uniref:Iron complex transport system ATP-binding protein n=1 Tax=Streptoalloteichus tenebrarius (strain ATCC 17920 / DSM 40477 / JCM 4838 / CBS 697.72 / NBRC 16177 / NCIMB 11028 / NRRL B-12390 / A12253. 1 / ISP 5477) TaxID=1933 RepID=A0ABT1HNE8_STRSD|nr:ABC transporter ATP-binding protein [Streptoalloteichus tenebrarius]MCP2257036.1 iron complex transport system ATP-binding protein [Streptoalloteichus tenebrarius]BFF00054.1 ABC transporter ATP-binding protein [Streptoalloteichus tenebrarius]
MTGSEGAPALQLRGVSAGYRGRWVVRDVDVTVPCGAWVAVIGPNGAGKSTLLKAAAGLVDHTGEVLLAGRPLGAMGRAARARAVGYAPQTPELPEGITVTDYVLFGRTPHLGPLARESRADLEIVADALARLDLADLAHRPLRTLSGGERQRAVLARALAQRADLLLLDEPTTGLDIGHAQALLDLVDELRRADGTTVVSTLHDLTLAAQYADELVLVDRGAVVAAGPPVEVLTADLLAARYSARVTILTTPDGTPVVAPVR